MDVGTAAHVTQHHNIDYNRQGFISSLYLLYYITNVLYLFWFKNIMRKLIFKLD